MCGGVVSVEFTVPDAVWHASVPKCFIDAHLCVGCFATQADERGVEWGADIQMRPVSRASVELTEEIEEEESPNPRCPRCNTPGMFDFDRQSWQCPRFSCPCSHFS